MRKLIHDEESVRNMMEIFHELGVNMATGYIDKEQIMDTYLFGCKVLGEIIMARYNQDLPPYYDELEEVVKIHLRDIITTLDNGNFNKEEQENG